MTEQNQYPVEISWQGALLGMGEIYCKRSGLRLPLSVPKEFKGLDKGTNPEELITASIAGCYTMLLGILLNIKNIPTKEIKVLSTGFIEDKKPKIQYNKVVLDVKIFLDTSATQTHEEKAQETALQAKEQCIMANATKGNVEVFINISVIN